jgi:hypothetical protein
MDQFRPTGKKPGDFFVSLGRFAPEKGADRAAEAAKKAGVPVVLAGTIDRHSQESMQYFPALLCQPLSKQSCLFRSSIQLLRFPMERWKWSQSSSTLVEGIAEDG